MQTHYHRQFWFMLVSLLLLRLVVGLHFFHEGVSKIKSDNFSCAGFLQQARGPLAPFFRSLLDDHDGRLRLCVSSDQRLEPERTLAIWEDYVETVAASAKFTADQRRQADRALAQASNYLTSYLENQESEILAWVASEDRLRGFSQDGERRVQTMQEIESLNDQVQTIKADRTRTAAPWFREIQATWDQLESRINEIAEENQKNRMFQLSRPFAQVGSSQDLIDRYLPWFDTTVGGLLVLGLFTRVAAIAGIGLLLGVVATQPFWIPGVENTFYQWIEICALLVLAAAAAGRFGGLDYFLDRRRTTEATRID
jgi:uncharacterized membrane protein YphA (DoxX/SURF4 family)